MGEQYTQHRPTVTEREAFENLANAIVVQAVKDYRNTRNHLQRKAILLFFRSPWFHILTKIEPEYLIDQLGGE